MSTSSFVEFLDLFLEQNQLKKKNSIILQMFQTTFPKEQACSQDLREI